MGVARRGASRSTDISIRHCRPCLAILQSAGTLEAGSKWWLRQKRVTRIVSKVNKDLGTMWRLVFKEQLPARPSGLLMYLDSPCALWVETSQVNILFSP